MRCHNPSSLTLSTSIHPININCLHQHPNSGSQHSTALRTCRTLPRAAARVINSGGLRGLRAGCPKGQDRLIQKSKTHRLTKVFSHASRAVSGCLSAIEVAPPTPSTFQTIPFLQRSNPSIPVQKNHQNDLQARQC